MLTALLASTVLASGLGGAPQLTRVDAHHATLRFAASEQPYTVGFAGDKRVRDLHATDKRHGTDTIYKATVISHKRFHAGTKYTARFVINGHATTVKIKLR